MSFDLQTFLELASNDQPEYYRNIDAGEALDVIAVLFDECSDSDGQWNGAEVCDAVYRVLASRGLVTFCDRCNSWYAAIRDTCPFHTVVTGMSAIAMLQHHLEHNLFPPLDWTWMPAAQAAIEAVKQSWRHNEVVDQQTLDTVLQTPAGFGTVQTVMDSLNLWDFVDQDDES